MHSLHSDTYVPFPIATFSVATHEMNKLSLSALNFNSALFGNTTVMMLRSMIGSTDIMLLTSMTVTFCVLGSVICNLDFSPAGEPLKA